MSSHVNGWHQFMLTVDFKSYQRLMFSQVNGWCCERFSIWNREKDFFNWWRNCGKSVWICRMAFLWSVEGKRVGNYAMSLSLSSRFLPLISMLSGLYCIQNDRMLQFFAWVGYLDNTVCWCAFFFVIAFQWCFVRFTNWF